MDTTDPAVMRLVEVYKSEEGRRFLWRVAVKLTGWLWAVAAVIVLVRRAPLGWEVPPSNLWAIPVVAVIGSFGALATEYIRWGLMTWAERETGRALE